MKDAGKRLKGYNLAPARLHGSITSIQEHTGFHKCSNKTVRERETDRGLDRNGVLDEVGKK